jgi:para-nitrobenzyl esterase
MAAAVAAPLTDARAAPTVATDTGTFTGVPSPSDPAAVNVFFGIRYAAPPVGNLRWSAPQPPISPAGPTVAAVPGPACPQAGSTATLPQSEDCLFLNVYVPATAQPNANLPVMLWIHGGALVSGTGAQYDPSAMAAENNIIVVTINYRLGALGWLVEPGLLAQTPSAFENIGDGGNYGLMDQQFAMQWTQRNIARFGGDPRKVTIAGESAGGLSVSSNLASITTAPGLFRHAIIESGAYMLHDLPSEAVYEALFAANFAAALDCTQPNDASCLRAASVTAILNAQAEVFGSFGISPDFGTKILPRSLEQAFATGEFIHVPVLQGTNANEGRLFEPSDIPFASTLVNIVAAGGPANFDLMNPNTFCAVPQGTGVPTVCSYPQEISLFLGVIGFPAADNSASFAASLAEDYPLAQFPDPFLPNNAPSADEALSQIFTDLVFACNGLDSNINLSQRVTVFRRQSTQRRVRLPERGRARGRAAVPVQFRHAAERRRATACPRDEDLLGQLRDHRRPEPPQARPVVVPLRAHRGGPRIDTGARRAASLLRLPSPASVPDLAALRRHRGAAIAGLAGEDSASTRSQSAAAMARQRPGHWNGRRRNPRRRDVH